LAAAVKPATEAANANAATRIMRNIEYPPGFGECAAMRLPAARSGHDTVNGMDPAERFEALLASGKDGALLRFSLGMHYLKAGDAARAAGHLRRAVEQDAEYSAAWKLLGKALADSGDTAGAAEAYRSGIAAADKRGDKQAAKEMGVFLRRLEKSAG
jgi:Flp pilus assembly protein TadD